MGTCIPAQLLDEHGCTTSAQNDIEQLSLITDRTCPPASSRLERLHQLKNLRHLAQQGVRDPREVTALCWCVREDLMHLETLRLSLGNGSMYAWDVGHGLNGFELAISECAIKLFSLRSLSLSNFTFTLLWLTGVLGRRAFDHFKYWHTPTSLTVAGTHDSSFSFAAAPFLKYLLASQGKCLMTLVKRFRQHSTWWPMPTRLCGIWLRFLKKYWIHVPWTTW